MQDESRTPIGWPVTATLVLIVGGILAAGTAALSLFLIGDPYQRGLDSGTGLSGFEMPGDPTRWSLEPGEYRIYYMYHVPMQTFGNSPYTLPATPPDIACTVTDQDSGEAIPVREPTSYRSYHSTLTDGTAIAAFAIPRRGTYLIDCKYADGATTPSVMLYQGPITPVTTTGTVLAIGAPWAAGVCVMGIAAAVAAVAFNGWRARLRDS